MQVGGPIVNNRHKRRAEIARFRRETGGALLTWLVDANDPTMHEAPPLVVRAAEPMVRTIASRAASLKM